MASNPPGICCTKKTLHEGEPIGKHVDLFGLNTYETGKQNGTDRVLVIVTDIFGNTLPNTQLIADEFSRQGYYVLVPDILKNDVYDHNTDFGAWISKHGPDVTSPIVKGYVSKVKEELKPKTLVGVGYCFGAKYVVQLLNENALFDAGALAHPSFVTIEEVNAITKPVLISAAQTDSIFTTELRHATEKSLAEANKTFQIDLFSGVEHGFAVRGDLSKPRVKYAKEKTFQDQLVWFSQY